MHFQICGHPSGTVGVSVTLFMLRSALLLLNTVYLVTQCGGQELIYIFNGPFDS